MLKTTDDDVVDKTFMADPAHPKLNNDALNISGTNRDGTKVAITNDYFKQVFASVSEKYEGVACAMKLSWLLGLRTEETVQSVKSLQTWKKALQNGDEKVRVVFWYERRTAERYHNNEPN